MRSSLWLVPSVLALLVVGCSSSDEPAATSDAGAQTDTGGTTDTGGPETTPLSLTFEARVGAEPFACDETYTNVGTTASTWAPKDFRFYVHDVRVVDDAGKEVPVVLVADGKWQTDQVALLDFEDKKAGCTNGTTDVNGTLQGTIPKGTVVKGVRFRVGVPEALNHQDQASAPSPLNLSTMFWSWADGYKHVRIEGASAKLGGFLVHLGSTDCSATGGATTCARSNRPEVALDAFDPTSSKVIVDLAKLLAGSDVDANGGGPPGCMSGATDPDCVPLFDRFGLAADGKADASKQVVFRAE